MRDSYGRTIEYLRISLTDKCNLRCKYCMPETGVSYLKHEDILSLEEVARLVRLLSNEGVKRVRLTGGEPLVRKNICKLISDIKNTDGIERVSLTTNGTMLKDKARELVDAGLDDVNISIDTLDREGFINLTGQDMLVQVLEGIEAAYNIGLNPKLNCVPIKDVNENQLVAIAGLARDKNIDVRFIELMPTSCGKNYKSIPNKDVIKLLEKHYGKLTMIDDMANQKGPATYYRIDGFMGRIGVISPISNVFCNSCNRVRLTSTGFFKLCLHHKIGIDLRGMIRNGSSDEAISSAIREAIKKKPKEHDMMKDADQTNMFQIGG